MRSFIIPLSLLLVVSCKPNVVEFPSLTPTETLEAYQGEYDITEMIWEEDASRSFDLDDDGSSSDIQTEFFSMPNIKLNWNRWLANIALYKTRSYNDGTIDMRFDGIIPFQCYEQMSGGIYFLRSFGDKWLFNFDFSIDPDGGVSPKQQEYSRPSENPSDYTVENDSIVITLQSYEPGKIVLRVEHTLYDFVSDKLIQGAILTTYTRISE